jgi:hypothetical protein
MITCHLMGGLGNQLFQIFCTIAYSIKYKKSFCFTNKKQLGEHGQGITVRYTYWESFLKNLQPFIKDFDYSSNMYTIREKGFEYKELQELYSDNILLFGYFQSYLYFQEYKTQIYKLIKLDQNKEFVKNLYLQEYNKKNNNNIHLNLSETISLHFRIGDYKLYPNAHPILDTGYYKKSLHYILDNTDTPCKNVLYFFEQNDIDEVIQKINILQKTFININFIPIDNSIGLQDWQEMLLMSLCKHNIIANSSFSWWGAYLNETENKIVCYPEMWFGPSLKDKIVKDLFPIEWVKLE